MFVKSRDDLESRMADLWEDLLQRPLARDIKAVLASGDRRLYGMWLCQVAHLTQHTSAHQALVGTRFREISFAYAKYCFEHAEEEVGHEMMAINDLKKIGSTANNVDELPKPLASTQRLTAFLYYAAQHAHPATRLGFSYWAEKCYPFVHMLIDDTLNQLGLDSKQMTFLVSHAIIDEKHAEDVERIVGIVCKTDEDWAAVEFGMLESLELAVKIFEEIYDRVYNEKLNDEYKAFLGQLQTQAPDA